MKSIKTYGLINWKDWYSLYKLEYQKSEIEKKAEFLSHYIPKDRLSAIYNSIKKDLGKLSDKMLEIYYKAFEDYVYAHVSEDAEMYLSNFHIANIFGKEFLSVYLDIQKAVDSDDTQKKILALNEAKNFTHNYNQYVVGLSGEPDIPELDIDYARYVWDNDVLLWTDDSVSKFYDDLTSNKYHKYWDLDIEKNANLKYATNYLGGRSNKHVRQQQVFKAKNKSNWYKMANKQNVAYHGTSKDKANKILTEGFNTYVSWEQFENYFGFFYNDLSSENQEKINIPNNQVGSKWENAVNELSNLWYDENPNIQIIWVTDNPSVAGEFGGVVLEVDIEDMDYFFDDLSYGWCMKYDGAIIPSIKFKILTLSD